VRRKPPPRRLLPRTSENEKRGLSPEPPSDAERNALAARATYGGYGKHKRNPHAWGLDPFHGIAPDRTFCEDTGFELADRQRIPTLLERGILAGLFGDLSSQGDPTMLWTIDDSGWIYELRLTTAGQALYHGYPLLPSNALGRKIIARFEAWLYSLPQAVRAQHPALRLALREAQNLYS